MRRLFHLFAACRGRRSSSSFLARNFHSERPVADQSARDANTAHVRLLHGAAHPSRPDIPLARRLREL